jgi:hypothetical protein
MRGTTCPIPTYDSLWMVAIGGWQHIGRIGVYLKNPGNHDSLPEGRPPNYPDKHTYNINNFKCCTDRKVFTTQQVRTTTVPSYLQKSEKVDIRRWKNICDRSSLSAHNKRRQEGKSTRHCIRKLIENNCVWASHMQKRKWKIESA